MLCLIASVLGLSFGWRGLHMDQCSIKAWAFSLQDLTDEQKVTMIRKELPHCTAEEAHTALEVSSMDVNVAVATLLQVCSFT